MGCLTRDKRRASYLLVIPVSSYDKVFNADLWEDGIMVRDFVRD